MKLKKLFSAMLSAAMLCGMALPAHAADVSDIFFDFEESDSGFSPIFADYPAQDNVEEFYEFAHSYGAVPIEGAGNGLFISGNNHSDDLFMGWYKQLDGFDAGKTYRFTVSFKLGTDVEGGMIGVGGSPGDSVYVKCGVAPIKPEAKLDASGNYRLNIDKSNQSQSGRDMRMVGTLTKELGMRPGEYEFNKYTATFDVTADADGCVYLIFGTDSGFEATSAWYLDDVAVSWTALTPVTRAEAAQMAYDALHNADDTAPAGTFRDVSADSQYAAAIGWAQAMGYLSGYGGGVFGPDDGMTVEQAFTMLYRCAGSPDVEDYMLEYLDYLIEPGTVSAWAKPAVAWAVNQGILTLSDDSTLKATICSVDWENVLEQIMVLYSFTVITDVVKIFLC